MRESLPSRGPPNSRLGSAVRCRQRLYLVVWRAGDSLLARLTRLGQSHGTDSTEPPALRWSKAVRPNKVGEGGGARGVGDQARPNHTEREKMPPPFPRTPLKSSSDGPDNQADGALRLATQGRRRAPYRLHGRCGAVDSAATRASTAKYRDAQTCPARGIPGTTTLPVRSEDARLDSHRAQG